MCGDCGIRSLGRYFCERHGLEVESPAGEEILYRAEDREALNYRHYLTQQGVDCRLFSADQDGGLLLDSSSNDEARIIVPSKHRAPARKWMASRSIDARHVLIQCERCSAVNGFDGGGCANCGGP